MEKRFWVEVVVDTDKRSLGENISTYVKRELRSLGDVGIDGEEEEDEFVQTDYTLSISPLKLGDTLYISVNYHIPISTVISRLLDYIAKDRQSEALRVLDGYGLLNGGVSYAFPLTKLRKYCAKLVTDFDNDILDALRRGKTPGQLLLERMR